VVQELLISNRRQTADFVLLPFCFISYKEKSSTKVTLFSKICYYTKFQDPTLSDYYQYCSHLGSSHSRHVSVIGGSKSESIEVKRPLVAKCCIKVHENPSNMEQSSNSKSLSWSRNSPPFMNLHPEGGGSKVPQKLVSHRSTTQRHNPQDRGMDQVGV